MGRVNWKEQEDGNDGVGQENGNWGVLAPVVLGWGPGSWYLCSLPLRFQARPFPVPAVMSRGSTSPTRLWLTGRVLR